MLKLAASLSRLGTESAFEILARAQALAAQGKDIINLGIGQPDFKTPKHIVEAGDTLSKLAQKYKTNVKAIQKLNQLSDTTIKVGDTLKIPSK